MATVNATYRWVESEARRVLREVLNAREKERRQEVTPPVAEALIVRLVNEERVLCAFSGE